MTVTLLTVVITETQPRPPPPGLAQVWHKGDLVRADLDKFSLAGERIPKAL